MTDAEIQELGRRINHAIFFEVLNIEAKEIAQDFRKLVDEYKKLRDNNGELV